VSDFLHHLLWVSHPPPRWSLSLLDCFYVASLFAYLLLYRYLMAALLLATAYRLIILYCTDTLLLLPLGLLSTSPLYCYLYCTILHALLSFHGLFDCLTAYLSSPFSLFCPLVECLSCHCISVASLLPLYCLSIARRLTLLLLHRC
jgi:hypothetical protein